MSSFRFPYANRLAHHSRSIADHIYETLRNDIIRGEIPLGHRLFEIEVAKTFDASRTPVREAFRRIEQDGLAERLPQGGIRVIELDEQTIRDLFNLRAILEVHAVELSCKRMTAEEVAMLKQIKAQAYELLKSGNLESEFALNLLFDLNSRFHDAIYNATRSKFLIRLLVNICAVVLSLRTISIRLDSVRKVWEEHSRLIDLLERRDTRAAVKLMNQHVADSAVQVLSYVRSSLPHEPGETDPATIPKARKQKVASVPSAK
jgi:DNA-binding GntR family transcriptional regulator